MSLINESSTSDGSPLAITSNSLSSVNFIVSIYYFRRYSLCFGTRLRAETLESENAYQPPRTESHSMHSVVLLTEVSAGVESPSPDSDSTSGTLHFSTKIDRILNAERGIPSVSQHGINELYYPKNIQ